MLVRLSAQPPAYRDERTAAIQLKWLPEQGVFSPTLFQREPVRFKTGYGRAG
jgi:hypothetical protein